MTLPPKPQGEGGGQGGGGVGGVVTLTLGNVDEDACLFDRLYERFGVNVTANLEMTDFGPDISQSEKFSFSGKGLKTIKKLIMTWIKLITLV